MMTEKEFNHIVLPLAQNIWSYALNLTGNLDHQRRPYPGSDVAVRDSRQQLSRVGNIKAWAVKDHSQPLAGLAEKTKTDIR